MRSMGTRSTDYMRTLFYGLATRWRGTREADSRYAAAPSISASIACVTVGCDKE